MNLGPGQQQALMAILLLSRARRVSRDEIIDGIWADSPPTSAVNIVQTYVTRLRRVLAPGGRAGAAGQVLILTRSGYALEVEPTELDLHVFEDHASRFRSLSDAGRPIAARQALAAALGVWRGPALAGVPGPFAGRERERLAERRISLVESRLMEDLRAGLDGDVISELSVLVTEHPYHEGLRALQMRALMQAGRQAEAHTVYRDVHRLLDRELGVAPGRRLQELHRRMLADAHDVRLQASVVRARFPGPAPVPRQLPPDVLHFVGREREARLLDDALTPIPAHGVAAAVTGAAGVGKTGLALHVAHRLQQRFPDGQLYVDLFGATTRPASPTTVLGHLLRELGVDPATIPADPDRRAALYRSIVHGRRMLIVLDDAQDAAQVRSLLPGSSTSRVLVTGQERMTDLEAARIVELRPLDPAPALALFTAIVSEARTRSEPAAASAVTAACGGLPLALRIAGARLAARPEWRIECLAARLRDRRRQLDELTVGDLSVRATILRSLDRLRGRRSAGVRWTPGHVLRLLARTDPEETTLDGVALLAGAPVVELEPVLADLVDLYLVEEPLPGRYRLPALLRLVVEGLPADDVRFAAGTLRTGGTGQDGLGRSPGAAPSQQVPVTDEAPDDVLQVRHPTP